MKILTKIFLICWLVGYYFAIALICSVLGLLPVTILGNGVVWDILISLLSLTNLILSGMAMRYTVRNNIIADLKSILLSAKRRLCGK